MDCGGSPPSSHFSLPSSPSALPEDHFETLLVTKMKSQSCENTGQNFLSSYSKPAAKQCLFPASHHRPFKHRAGVGAIVTLFSSQDHGGSEWLDPLPEAPQSLPVLNPGFESSLLHSKAHILNHHPHCLGKILWVLPWPHRQDTEQGFPTKNTGFQAQLNVRLADKAQNTTFQAPPLGDLDSVSLCGAQAP